MNSEPSYGNLRKLEIDKNTSLQYSTDGNTASWTVVDNQDIPDGLSGKVTNIDPKNVSKLEKGIYQDYLTAREEFQRKSHKF